MKALNITATIAVATCLLPHAYGQKADFKKSPLFGTWSMQLKRGMNIQQFQDDKLTTSYVHPDTKIIEHHSCKHFEHPFELSKYVETTKFATKDWAKYINVQSQESEITFTATSYATRENGSSKDAWKTWQKMKDLGETQDINGVWSNKGSMREFTLKSFRDGYCFTTEIETISSRVRRATIGTFSLIDGVLTEKIIYATEERKARLGDTTSVTVTKDKDGLTFKDQRGMTELWTRVPKIK